MTATRTLEGITVVALEQAVAMPFATRQLADLGARVIKVERPDVGDFARAYDTTVLGQSSYFVWLNRGKESIELDLKDPLDLSLLETLISRADVFAQNLIPGAVERMGLGADRLRQRDPRLITCSVSGYGSTGPYREKKAYDLLVQCEAGLLDITGNAEHRARTGISIADIAAGMYAYSGILAALYERETTGSGSALEVAMLDALGEWMSQPAYFYGYSGQPSRRTGPRHASIAPYGPYRTGDGGTVFLGVQNEREWSLLCERILARPELVKAERFATNTNRVAHDDELTALIEEVLATMTLSAAIAALDAVGIANAEVRTPQQFVDHPQLEARNRWRTIDSPAGPIRALLPPVTVQDREPDMNPIPSLGQHNAALRTQLGFPPERTSTQQQ